MSRRHWEKLALLSPRPNRPRSGSSRVASGFLLPGRIALGGDVWIYRGWNREFCSTSGDNAEICSTAANVDSGTGFGIAVGASATFFFPVGGRK